MIEAVEERGTAEETWPTDKQCAPSTKALTGFESSHMKLIVTPQVRRGYLHGKILKKIPAYVYGGT
jgi:hypothetical protein